MVYFLSDDLEVLDDYTAPNETGSPSPAPALPTASRGGAGGAMLRSPPAHFVGAPRTSTASVTGVGSEAVMVEYSVSSPKTGGSGGGVGGVHLKKTPPIISTGAAPASTTPWKHPPYERIVRGVECIIVRIRSLLDVSLVFSHVHHAILTFF